LNTFARNPSEGIDHMEYLLFRAASTHFDSILDNYPECILVYLRRLWLFKLYDFDDSNTLTIEELRQLIRELAAGDGHTNYILTAMGINEATHVMLDQFMGSGINAAFDQFKLDPTELLQVLHSLSCLNGNIFLVKTSLIVLRLIATHFDHTI
jgi:hypothetical protein